MRIVPAAPEQDGLLAEFYGRHWLEMGAAAEPGWRERALAFIGAARRERGFAGFLAEAEGRAVGCACCHRVERVFPAFRPDDAARLGYVWGLYVEPGSRGRGLGSALLPACLAHLRAEGCGRALLHAGERSRPLYLRHGFAPTEELALRL